MRGAEHAEKSFKLSNLCYTFCPVRQSFTQSFCVHTLDEIFVQFFLGQNVDMLVFPFREYAHFVLSSRDKMM